jgi:hypothetical protein
MLSVHEAFRRTSLLPYLGHQDGMVIELAEHA